MTLLVTTALEDGWGEDEQLLFLGEWCRLYDRRDVWMNRAHTVVPHHWYDRTKLAKDYVRLAALHDALLTELAQALNRYHDINRSLRYWQILLDPWLLTYIAVVFDRWECLRVAFQSNQHLETISLPSNPEFSPPAGYDDFNVQVLGDAWNSQLFLEIIRCAYPDRCVIRPQPSTSTSAAIISSSKPRAPQKQRSGITELLDSLLALLPGNAPAVLFNSYFPPAALVRLSFRLGQLPRLYLTEFSWSPASREFLMQQPGVKARRSISLGGVARDKFEEYLRDRLIKDIPYCYVEGFSSLRTRAADIRLRPRAIFTANAHWGNELFKMWCAEKVLRGVKLITMEHGGSIPPRFDTMLFEEQISDVRTTWSLPHEPNHVRLPANKVVTRFNGSKKSNKKKRRCLAVGFEAWRYTHRATAYPVSGQVLASFDMLCNLYSLLDTDARDAFFVKPFPNLGWNTHRRFVDRLGTDKVSEGRTYYELLDEARFVVCTYPNTTFAEAMASDTPTILMYPPEIFETAPEFDPLLDALIGAKIVFHNAEDAAKHINQVWGNVDAWWEASETLAERAEFKRVALDVADDWLSRWRLFIDRMVE